MEGPGECGGCGHLVKDRYYLLAAGAVWHQVHITHLLLATAPVLTVQYSSCQDCLTCSCCQVRLAEVCPIAYCTPLLYCTVEVGSSLWIRYGLRLCKRDLLRLADNDIMKLTFLYL